jgi:hypothetical protein
VFGREVLTEAGAFAVGFGATLLCEIAMRVCSVTARAWPRNEMTARAFVAAAEGSVLIS